MNPLHLLVVDLETRPDTAILPADRDPAVFPKPIQHEIVTLGFLLARIERDGQGERYTVRKRSTELTPKSGRGQYCGSRSPLVPAAAPVKAESAILIKKQQPVMLKR